MSQLPAPLIPSPGSRGLATADLAGLGERVIGGWQAFLDVAAEADLGLPSRKAGWSGHDIVVHLGAWDDARTLDDILDDARQGRVHTVDQSALGRALIDPARGRVPRGGAAGCAGGPRHGGAVVRRPRGGR